MRKLYPLLHIACCLLCTATIAQKQIVYPSVSVIRSSLQQLVESKKNAFQDIKGAFRYTKGTVSYYEANLHFMPGDTARIAEDTQPLQVYYFVFFHQGMEEVQSKTVFAQWQKLVAESLPTFTRSIENKQYSDLESVVFTSPDNSTKFTLYRNGSNDKCQVSISIVNNNAYEIAAAYDKKPKSVTVKPAPHKDSVKTTKKEPVVTATSETQLRMQKTLTALLADRVNGFRNFKGNIIASKGTPTYTAKGTDYAYAEDLVEFIEVQATLVMYKVIVSGETEAEECAAAYRQVLSAAQLQQGYKYNAVQENGKTKTFSISYKGTVISKCIYTNNGDDSETTITMNGNTTAK